MMMLMMMMTRMNVWLICCVYLSFLYSIVIGYFNYSLLHFCLSLYLYDDCMTFGYIRVDVVVDIPDVE